MNPNPSPDLPKRPKLSSTGMSLGAYNPLRFHPALNSALTPSATSAHESLWTADPSEEIARVARDLVHTTALVEKFNLDSIQYIASGGMGHVFAGLEKNLDTWRAIKVMIHSESTEAIDNFRAEASLAAKLRHPNLLPIHDFGRSSEGRPYFTMDLVEAAQTLQEEIALYHVHGVRDISGIEWRSRENPMMRLFLESLDALEYLHQQKIVHRDLKPGNILVANSRDLSGVDGTPREHAELSSRRVYVTDFGLSLSSTARAVAEQSEQIQDDTHGQRMTPRVVTAYGHIFKGTAEYAAPEQTQVGGVITAQTDVYQLGLILRYMLTGQEPFPGEGQDRGEILERIRTARDPRQLYGDPKFINASIPADLLSIVNKALQVEPAARYVDAAEFKRDVQAFLDGRSVKAHRESLVGYSRVRYSMKVGMSAVATWVVSNKSVAAGMLAATIASGVGVNTLLRIRSREAENRLAELRGQEELKRVELQVREGLERARELRESARQMADVGKLETAVALVAKETLEDLRRKGSASEALLSLVEVVEQETAERRAILEMRVLEMQGYMAAIAHHDPNVLTPFDKKLLRQAREQCIAGDLHENNLEDFREKMARSGYSQEQRKEIAASIARISVALLTDDLTVAVDSPERSDDSKRAILRELQVIARFCEACGIEVQGQPGRYAIPTALSIMESVITHSLGERYQPRNLPNPHMRSDATTLHMAQLPTTRSLLASVQTFDHLLEAVKQDPDSFVLNILTATSGYTSLAPNFRSDIARLSTAVECQISAYESAQQMALERAHVGVRTVKMIMPLVLASRSIPVIKRPNMLDLVIRAEAVVLDLEQSYPEMSDNAEVQQLKCLLNLVSGAPPPEKSLRAVSQTAGFEGSAAYMRVWWQALFGLEVDRAAAQGFIEAGGAVSDPITAALILHRVGKNEEAFALLEKLVSEEPAWREDLQQNATDDLAGLRAVNYPRYDQLSSGVNN